MYVNSPLFIVYSCFNKLKDYKYNFRVKLYYKMTKNKKKSVQKSSNNRRQHHVKLKEQIFLLKKLKKKNYVGIITAIYKR